MSNIGIIDTVRHTNSIGQIFITDDTLTPSVHWCYWLGNRNCIRSVKTCCLTWSKWRK